jgi:hypothetical protein
MNNKEELIDSITTALDNDIVADYDEINTRECTSENYDGFSITVTGYRVPIRPMIEAVAPFDEWRVENVGMYGDIPSEEEYEYGITMFCAYVGQEFENNIFT